MMTAVKGNRGHSKERDRINKINGIVHIAIGEILDGLVRRGSDQL
jgi:hypothetical protein